MITTEKCPGSVPENDHYLHIISESTGNRICKSPKCFFLVKYKDGTGKWKEGFDPTNAKTFVQEKVDDVEAKDID